MSADIPVAAGSAGKAIPIQVYGKGAKNPVLNIDFAGLKDIGTVKLPDTCKVTGSTAACALVDIEQGTLLPLILSPTGKLGSKGSFTLSAKADNLADLPASTSTVTLVDGIDLVALPLPLPQDFGTVKAGDARQLPIEFKNVGNQPAAVVTLSLYLEVGITPSVYHGCEYDRSEWAATKVTCTINGPVAPGESVRMVSVDEHGTETDGLGVSFAADAFDNKQIGFTVEAQEASAHLRAPNASSPGVRQIKLKPVGSKRLSAKVADVDDNDNSSWTMVDIQNTYDFAALGATARGKAGDVVTVTIGEHNNGPASVDTLRSGGEKGWGFVFTRPPGTEVVRAPSTCESVIGTPPNETDVKPGAAGGSIYRCWPVGNRVQAKTSVTVAFDLKITNVLIGATGTVGFSDPFYSDYQQTDSDPSNDTAPVVINPPATVAGGAVAIGGTLAVTGPQAGAAAAASVGLIGSGLAMYVMGRRRRSILIASAGEDEVTA